MCTQALLELDQNRRRFSYLVGEIGFISLTSQYRFLRHFTVTSLLWCHMWSSIWCWFLEYFTLMTSQLPLKDLNATLNAFEPWAFFQQSWHGTCIPYYFKVVSKDLRLLHPLLHQAFGNRSITVYTCFIDLKRFFATLVRTTISLMRGKRFINRTYNSRNLSFYRILKDGKEWKAYSIFKRKCPF